MFFINKNSALAAAAIFGFLLVVSITGNSQNLTDETLNSKGTSVNRVDLLKNLQNNKTGQGDVIIDTRPAKDVQKDGSEDKESKDQYLRFKGEQPEEPLSQIEEKYNERLAEKVKLLQFGYNFFRRQLKDNFLPVGDSYNVGPGDTISVYFWRPC